MATLGSVSSTSTIYNGVGFPGYNYTTIYHKFIHNATPTGWNNRAGGQSSSFRTHSQSKCAAIRYATSTSSGTAAGLILGFMSFGSAGNPWFDCRIATVDSANVRYYVGLRDANTTYNSASDKYLMIKSTNGGAWTAICANAGGAESSTSLTDSPSTGTLVNLSIRMNSTTSATFYINGVSKGTLSSNLPSSDIAPCIEVFTDTTSSKSIDICYLSAWQDL